MKSESSKPAFTLIELLVVIAIMAILAVLLLPAMAAAKRRARVTQCQSNFHQVYVASFVYANDYHDYFPIYGSIGLPNFLAAVSDASYVIHNVVTGGGLPPHTMVTPGVPAVVFQNLGLLYELHMIGDGKVFYCPGYPDTSIFSAVRFSNPALMSTDTNSWVRSSMLYNPEVVLPDHNRIFPKTGSLIAGRLFGMDSLQAQMGSGTHATVSPLVGTFTADTFAHYPSLGFDVLFTDGSAKFVRSAPAINYLTNLDDTYSVYPQFFQMLETAR